MNKRISFVFACLMLLAVKAYTQVYPVSTLTQVAPPFPQSLSGFVDQVANKITLQVNVNDVTLANYPVKLRMTLRSNTVTITTSASYNTQPVYLNGGEVLTLNSADLADFFRLENLDFSGYSKARYHKTGQLPDGVYQLSFEVIDYARGYTISSSFPAFIYIYINDAPILNLPLNKKKIDFSPLQNIGFNWTFRHSPFSRPGLSPRYTFELWEVYPDNLDPYFVVRSRLPIYTEELTGTSLNYTIMHPLLVSGRTYAWRVRVTDPDGITTFKNDGFSDVYWFKYGVSCTPPLLTLESASPSSVDVSWETEQLQSNYTVRYRPTAQEQAEWYSESTNYLSHTISNLRSNTEYTIEVEGNCGSQASGYSEPLTVTTDMNLEYQCGQDGDIPEIENQEKLTSLSKGTHISAGDFDVEIFQVSGSGGVFNGKGFVLVPMLNFLKLEADLENISVNTDYQLIGGKVKTVYNLSNSMTINLSDVFPDGGNAPLNEQNDFEDIADIKVDADDSITSVVVTGNTVTVTTGSGDVISETVSPGKIVAVTAPSGGQYVVDGSTNTVFTQGTPSGTAPSGNSSGLSQESEATAKFKVSFMPDQQQFYGFDAPESETLAESYKEVSIRGQQTRIPWKSLESGRFDKLLAKIEGSPTDSLFFSRESASMVMVAPTINDDTKQLMVTGQGHEDTDELYAWYNLQPADTGKPVEAYHAGSISLVSYQKQTIKLVLVGINGSMVPGADQVQESLNKIYKQAVVDWQVSVLEGGITVQLPHSDQKIIDNTDADSRMDYTDDMKLAIKALKESPVYDKHTYYLFLADKSTDNNIKGYMPLKGQFGFIFRYSEYPDSYSRTIAHEVGHGAFRLRHTFSSKNKYTQNQGSTNNLMDYSPPTATQLNKYQWDLIHDPQAMIALFQDEEEGAAHVYLEDDITLGNYAGHEDILQYLLSDGLERLLYEIEVYQYFQDGQINIDAAEIIISNVLGNVLIGDRIEAAYLLEEFANIYNFRLVSQSHDEIMEMIYSSSSDEFPEDNFVEIITKILGYANPTTTGTSVFVKFYKEVWNATRGFDKMEIDEFRENLIISLGNKKPTLDFTRSGLNTALSKMSNTQIKKLYKEKLPSHPPRKVKDMVHLRRNGVHNYDDLIKVLDNSDKAKIIGTLDDLTLASIRTPTNFNSPSALGKALDIAGNAVNMLQLINYVKNDVDVSPLDVLGFVPHPVSMYSILFDMIVSDEIEKINQTFYEEAPDWDFVLNWSKLYKGKPGLPNESLYICYTDQKTKFNSGILPTSIIFKNKEDAIRVLKFDPTIADFDIKSKMGKVNGTEYFKPYKQVTIEWQKKTQIGLPTPGF